MEVSICTLQGVCPGDYWMIFHDNAGYVLNVRMFAMCEPRQKEKMPIIGFYGLYGLTPADLASIMVSMGRD